MLPVSVSTTTPIVASAGIRNEELNLDWLNYFDPEAALRSVIAHIATLPSSRTAEKHTLRNYESGLRYFFALLSGHDVNNLTEDIWYYVRQPMPMVTESIMLTYIGHLSLKGLSASTIANKYQIPARHWLRALTKQSITGISDIEKRLDIEDYRRVMGNAVDVKAPQSADSSNLSALHRHGTRLSLMQQNILIQHLEQDTNLTGMRDLALIYTGLTSALRVSELSRITLASIKVEGECYTITVRGKRGQIDPVTIDETAFILIKRYVDSWNASLLEGENDPRYIDDHTPIWQATRAGRPEGVGVNRYNPATGISRNSLRDIISRRTKEALGIEVNPHDLRRTYAYNMNLNDQPIEEISQQLRHKSVDTTKKYIGEMPNMKARVYTNYVKLVVSTVGK